MSTKFFLLLLGTLLLVQCVLSDCSEETSKDDSKHSSDEMIDDDNLGRHVIKWYVKLLDQAFSAALKTFEPVINDVQINNNTTNIEVQDKLTKLNKALKKANILLNTTNFDDERRDKNNVMKEIFEQVWNLKEIEDETSIEVDETIRKANEILIKDIDKNIETFANRTVQAIEKLWNGLSTTDQNDEQYFRDAVTKFKNITSMGKLEILDKLFTLSDDNVVNAAASQN